MILDKPPTGETIGQLVARLIQDARAFANAEIALYKARLSGWAGAAKSIALLAVTAVVLAHGAIIALFVGLLLTLQPLVGPGWATLIVVTGSLALAGLSGWLAWARIRKLSGTAGKP